MTLNLTSIANHHASEAAEWRKLVDVSFDADVLSFRWSQVRTHAAYALLVIVRGGSRRVSREARTLLHDLNRSPR